MVEHEGSDSEYFGFGESKRNPEDLQFEAVEFPTDPYDRLGNILGGVINMAPKSLLMYAFPHDEAYADPDELTQIFNQHSNGTSFENFRKAYISDYMRHSLEGAGLVAQALELQEGDVPSLVGYALTEAGEVYGKRSAALALQLEGRYPDIDIYSIFGATASSSESGLRAPYIRARILLDIAAGREDIAPFVSVSSSYRTLEALKENGLVDFSREKLDRARIRYRRTEVPLENISYLGQMSDLKDAAIKACERFFYQGRVVTSETLAQDLYPQFKESWKQENIKRALSPIFEDLVNARYVEGIRESWNVRSRLTSKGARVVTEFLDPLIGLLSDDPQAVDYIDSQVIPEVDERILTYVPLALERYYPHSRVATREKMKEAEAYILDAFAHRGETVTLKELAQELNVSYDSLLKRAMDLVKKGQLVQEKNKARGKPDTYRVPPSEDS
jgi:uncharacterized membrane protein